MRVLITGASGLLGRRMFDIISKTHETLGTYNKNNYEKFHFLDITDKNSVDLFFEKIKPKAVIHCAALVDTDRCEEDKELASKINVEGTKNIVENCRGYNCKMVFLSSDFVFDGEAGPYYEDDELKAINYYGLTKIEGEKIVKQKLEDCLIIRPAIMYGFDEYSKASFITQVLEKLEKGERVYADNKIIKYPTLTDDVVKAIKELINLELSGIYHVCGEEGITKYEWAKKIAKFYGYSEDLIAESNNQSIAKRPPNANLDSSKIKKVIGNLTSVNEGIRETFKTEFAKKYNFKIIRSDQIPLEDRTSYGGYSIRRLFTETIDTLAENIGFYETTIHANSIVKNHYHKHLDEILYFFSRGTIRIGSELVMINPKDVVIIPRGVPHEVISGEEEIKLLAIKIPNILEDKIIC